MLGSGLEGSRRLTADPANCPVSRDLDVEQKRTVQRIDPIAVYDYASGMQQKIVNELGRTDPLLECETVELDSSVPLLVSNPTSPRLL